MIPNTFKRKRLRSVIHAKTAVTVTFIDLLTVIIQYKAAKIKWQYLLCSIDHSCITTVILNSPVPPNLSLCHQIPPWLAGG